VTERSRRQSLLAILCQKEVIEFFMRIVVVQDYLRMGGTEKQTVFLCDELLKAGHDAHLILFRPGGSLWNDMLAKKIPHTVLQPFDSHVCFLAPGLTENIEKRNPHVILCMGRTANCLAGLIQSRFRNAAVVSTLRTGKVLFPLHYWALGYVRAVLVNSNWWRRRMLERGFPEERVKLIHNPLMLRYGPAERGKWRDLVRRKTGAGPTTRVYLDIAALRSGKRHIELLECFRRFAAKTTSDWQLWIVGTGRELENCKLFTKQHGLDKRVHFFGLQTQTVPYYAGADVAVSASREDSLPNFLIEAQAMGLPLVAVDCRGVEECCIPGKTGLIIPPDKFDEFAKALENTATDDTLLREAAEFAPSFAHDHFGATRQAALTLSFLETLAAKNRTDATKRN
jgi:glycosyltransferase involved in cell wall biosynthesis